MARGVGGKDRGGLPGGATSSLLFKGGHLFSSKEKDEEKLLLLEEREGDLQVFEPSQTNFEFFELSKLLTRVHVVLR